MEPKNDFEGRAAYVYMMMPPLLSRRTSAENIADTLYTLDLMGMRVVPAAQSAGQEAVAWAIECELRGEGILEEVYLSKKHAQIAADPKKWVDGANPSVVPLVRQAAPVNGSEPIYQLKAPGHFWNDVSRREFDEYKGYPDWQSRILYAAPVNGGTHEAVCDRIICERKGACTGDDVATARGCKRAADAQQVGGEYDGDSEHSRAAFRAYDDRVSVSARTPWQIWRDACAWQAALTSPAKVGGEYGDAYQGPREDLAIWKKRALEAEELNRKFIAEVNGPTHMGEPAKVGSDKVSASDWWAREGHRTVWPHGDSRGWEGAATHGYAAGLDAARAALSADGGEAAK